MASEEVVKQFQKCLSPALNGSSEIWCFERSDAIEISNGIIFDFYMGLPYMVTRAWDVKWIRSLIIGASLSKSHT